MNRPLPDLLLVVVLVLLAAGVRCWNHAAVPWLYQSNDSWYWYLQATRCDASPCDMGLIVDHDPVPVYPLARGVHLAPWSGHWLNLALASLAVGAVYLLAREAGIDRRGAFLAGLFAACSPVFLARTSIHWLDTDGGNLLFMLLISLHALRGGWWYILAGLSGFAFGFWWYGAPWFGVVLIVWTGLNVPRRPWWVVPLVVVLVVLVLVSSGLHRRVVNLTRSVRSWEPLYIAELRPPRPHELPGFICAGWLPFLVALYGTGQIPTPRYTRLVFVWASLGLITSLAGVRFLLLAVPPLALAFGAGASRLRSGPAWPLVVLSVFVFTWYAYAAPPMVRYTWADVAAARVVGDQVPPDGVVVAWWDHGAFLSAVTGREVLATATNQADDKTRAVARVLCSLEAGDLIEASQVMDRAANGRPWVVYKEAFTREGVPRDAWVSLGGCGS